jgi:hypothetical protein
MKLGAKGAMTTKKAPSLSRSEGFPICGYCVQDNYVTFSIEVHQCFGGTYRLHLQTRLAASLFARWSKYVPPKRRCSSTGLHDVAFQLCL